MDLSWFRSINSFMQKLINKKMGYSGLGLLLKRALHFSFCKTDNPNNEKVFPSFSFSKIKHFFSPPNLPLPFYLGNISLQLLIQTHKITPDDPQGSIFTKDLLKQMWHKYAHGFNFLSSTDIFTQFPLNPASLTSPLPLDSFLSSQGWG